MNYSYKNRYKTIDTLQPELKWTDILKPNQTYDLCIWEAPYRNAEDVTRKEEAQSSASWGIAVYSTNGITANFHQVSVSLKPDAYYNWAVRVRDGNRIMPWSSFSQSEEAYYVLASAVIQHRNVAFGFKTPHQ